MTFLGLVVLLTGIEDTSSKLGLVVGSDIFDAGLMVRQVDPAVTRGLAAAALVGGASRF